MNMKKATVCTITKRKEPQIDKTIMALKKQNNKEFEYLIVDSLYYERKDKMRSIIKAQNADFEINYVPNKPTRWKNFLPSVSSARNTALIWAKCEKIIIIDDCCVDMCVDLVNKHINFANPKTVVSGTWCLGGRTESRQKMFRSERYIDINRFFYGANCSYDLKEILEVNGYEELFDGEQGQEDCLLGIMLAKRNIKLFFDPMLWVKYDLSTHSLLQWSPDPLKAEWKKEGNLVEPKRIVLNDGLAHFANEWITQQIINNKKQLVVDNNQTITVGNPHYKLDELRKIVISCNYDIDNVQKELIDFIDKNPYDWRDGELISDIEKRLSVIK